MLSDHAFELLVADLLRAELRIIFEVFAPGPDDGVDLRHIRHDGLIDLVQCKYIRNSTFAQ